MNNVLSAFWVCDNFFSAKNHVLSTFISLYSIHVMNAKMVMFNIFWEEALQLISFLSIHESRPKTFSSKSIWDYFTPILHYDITLACYWSVAGSHPLEENGIREDGMCEVWLLQD